MSKTAVERLAHLLDVERAALLTGDFDTVAALLPQKEALANEFDEADGSALAPLADALKRNGMLLTAAREGVSVVVTTLQKQRDARSSLSSYDINGNAKQISQPTRGTERRF